MTITPKHYLADMLQFSVKLRTDFANFAGFELPQTVNLAYKFTLMKKLILFITMCFSFLVTIQSCTKQEAEETIEYFVPQELLDYFYFQPGTMWVYKNSKTNELDTITVVKTTRNLYQTTKTSKEELVNVYVTSSFIGWGYIDRQAVCRGCSGVTNGKAIGCDYSLMYPMGQGYEFYEWKLYPFVAKVDSSSSYVSKIDVYDSLQLSNKLYYKVVKAHTKNINKQTEMQAYFAKDVGLIKQEIFYDSVTWELIDYKIVK